MQTTMRKKLALRKIKRELEDPEINRGRGGGGGKTLSRLYEEAQMKGKSPNASNTSSIRQTIKC